MLRGLEPVVAVVLLIVVVVMGFVLVYLWFSGYVDRFIGVAGQAAEMFKVEAVSLATNGSVRLFIRNIGGVPVSVSTIYVYPVGSLNPLCVKQGANAVISPGALARVGTTLTCTTTPTPGGSYVIKVITTKGTEIAYTVTASTTLAAVGGGDVMVVIGDDVACTFAASGGKRFGSPDGTPATGFNELNGWVAAWGSSGGGVRVALMPGITPPDSTNTGTSYTVELVNVQIGTLTISGGITSVSIAEPMPGFMQVVRIWLEPGGHVLYDNGPRPAVNVAPGTYQVRATLRVAPSSAVYGAAADLTLRCIDSSLATITLRVPDPNEWGIRVDLYIWTAPPSVPPWPPFGAGYIYRGTWSVGAVYLSVIGLAGYNDPIGVLSPYVTSAYRLEAEPKWAAYWVDPTGPTRTLWAARFRGRLYVPWSSIRVGVWRDNGAYVRLCSIDTGNSWWNGAWYVFETTSGTCASAGEHSVEIGLYDGGGSNILIFLIGPGGGGEAYVPTIDGAWYCSSFNWSTGRCNVAWSFVSATSGVPHFVVTNYTPGSSDGGGSLRP